MQQKQSKFGVTRDALFVVIAVIYFLVSSAGEQGLEDLLQPQTINDLLMSS
jgi:hypothetical protein